MMEQKELPKLRMEWSYDHTSGLFFARLENGSLIPVERKHVSGKLENALNLYRGACIALIEEGGYKLKPHVEIPDFIQAEVDRLIAEGKVTKPKPPRERKVPTSPIGLEDLDLEIEL